MKDWNITKNKQILEEYEKHTIKQLPENILKNGVIKTLMHRTKSKMIYECRDKKGIIFYEVFINFVVPVPLKFWVISLYDYQEIYPDKQDYGYRAWIFYDKTEALRMFISMK